MITFAQTHVDTLTVDKERMIMKILDFCTPASRCLPSKTRVPVRYSTPEVAEHQFRGRWRQQYFHFILFFGLRLTRPGFHSPPVALSLPYQPCSFESPPILSFPSGTNLCKVALRDGKYITKGVWRGRRAWGGITLCGVRKKKK
jgi:hypothetical protein